MYGKQVVMPGDVTLGVFTVLVEKGLVEYSGVGEESFLDKVRQICASSGFEFVLSH